MGKKESAYKPGSVEGDHSSGIHVTVNLKQPTRKRTRIGAAPDFTACRRNRRSCFPIWPCSRWGLPCRPCYQGCGALLPHRFTLTVLHGLRREVLGGLFSVALSVGSRLPGVTWHLIRRSPDFPPLLQARAAITQPTPRVHCPIGRNGCMPYLHRASCLFGTRATRPRPGAPACSRATRPRQKAWFFFGGGPSPRVTSVVGGVRLIAVRTSGRESVGLAACGSC